MGTDSYKIFRLDNGLRVVVNSLPGNVSYIGLVVNAGSRDEDSDKEGLAHFVEHTIFKGTEKRRAWQISARMEAIGGELNAYTSKDETAVYTNAPAGHTARALELLADLVMNSRFPEAELDKEREVVTEEIYSYLDSPSDSVFDEFEELAFAGSGMAHNILGSTESVQHLHSEDCRRFLDRFYVPSNMVVYAMCPDNPEKVAALVEKYFGRMHNPEPVFSRSVPEEPMSFDLTRNRGNHQANTVVGARLFGRHDPRRPALFLLNNYLGGPCMNSRLNRELRELRGYVYTVESTLSLYQDTGLLCIYFGCDPSTIGKCMKIIRRELDRLVQNTLPLSVLEKIKRQYCGQLMVSTDNRESRAMSMGKSLLYYDRIFDSYSMIEQVADITADQLRSVAELIAPQCCSRLTII